jgi:cysteinyl-tRNA synthetase
MTEAEQASYDATEEFVKKFEAAMDDDANTADAVSAVFELVKYANTNASSANSKEYLQKLYDRLNTLCDVLGIILEQEEELLDADVEALIKERTDAKKAKNFARADEIREELKNRGIILEDTREGVKWKRA